MAAASGPASMRSNSRGKAVERGAGEILLTSMDRDGTKAGYDIALTRAIADAVRAPVIATGGVGTLDHLVEGIRDGHATAVLAASIFHFGTYTIARGQGAYGERRACRATGLRNRLILNGRDMADFTLADLERIVAERGRSGDPEFVDGEAVRARHRQGRAKARRGGRRDGDRGRQAATPKRSSRKAPIFSIIGSSSWRSPASRCHPCWPNSNAAPGNRAPPKRRRVAD